MTAPIFVMQPENMVAKDKNAWYNGFIVSSNLIDKSEFMEARYENREMCKTIIYGDW